MLCLQIYFLPDPGLSSIPFCALRVGGRFLIEKALVAQASSLRTLDCARIRWDAICSGPPSSPAPEVGLEEGWAGGELRRKQSVCMLACLLVVDLSLYIKCILAVQALVVKYDDSIVLDMLGEELAQLLPAEVVSGDDATKENVIERVTSGSASLVHFLVHGTPGGRAESLYFLSSFSGILSQIHYYYRYFPFFFFFFFFFAKGR